MELQEKQITKALFQFILPFTFKIEEKATIFSNLDQHQFSQNQLNEFDAAAKGFQRYSKTFQDYSVEIFICPFEIGFLNIRTESASKTLLEAIEFAATTQLLDETIQDLSIDLFIQIDRNELFVQSLLTFSANESITDIDIFRLGNLNGLKQDGTPYIAANNVEYIHKVVKQNSYERWVPKQFYFVGESSFACLTTELTIQVESNFLKKHFACLIIHLFYKRVFSKITEEYAKINLDQDQKKMGRFIYFINSFTSNYYFPIMPADSEEKELFTLFRKSFSIDQMYIQTKDSLESLFKYDESTTAKRDSFLLLVLTLYTIVCGVFSTNLFEIERKIHWGHMGSYKYFQYFAVFLVFSGLIAALFLGIQSLYKGILERRNRKKWVQESVFSAKKR